MEKAAQLDDLLLQWMTKGEGDFESLAYQLFRYQFENNQPYRRLCLEQGITPDNLQRWQDIPAVPTLAFKYFDLVCEPKEQAEAIFYSSGTTSGPERRSRHYLFNLRLYEASVCYSFQRYLLPLGERLPMYILMPPPEEIPHSSLARMFGIVKSAFGSAGSDYFLSSEGNPLFEALSTRLQSAEEPVMLLGPSFSFVHFLDYCEENQLSFRLPPGSRLMDTGGYKGRSREVPREELLRKYHQVLGIPPEFCVNEYGMCELTSQYYENHLRSLLIQQEAPRCWEGPPWLRSFVVHPETGRFLPKGEVGLLRHFDLGNRGSVIAVQTEDLGYTTDQGIVLIGRVPSLEPRGCSLLVDELLRASGD